MRVQTEKQVVYLRQKQGRNPYPKRSAGILGEVHNKSKTRQIHTQRERVGVSSLRKKSTVTEKPEARQRYTPGEEC